MAPRWSEFTPREGKVAIGPSREGQIAAIAARQQWLITAQQLISCGLSRGGIEKRAAGGRLHRIHQGVYATHPQPYSRNQLWLAAVLACGPGALLCGPPAADLWTLIDNPPLIAHVSVPNGRGRSRNGIRVHRRATDSRDIRTKHGIPCVSVDLVLIEFAPNHSSSELETMMVAADSLRLLKRGRLSELVTERQGRPGIHKLASLLALEPQLARSDLELFFAPIWRQAGVARPKVNYPIAVPGRSRPLSVDFAWPEIKMVVEADSQRFHGDWEQAEIDRERDQLLALAGWVSHRFVRRKIVKEPGASAERLRLLTEVRVAELSRSPYRSLP